MAIVLRTYPKIFPEKFKTFGYPDIEMQRPELGLLFLTLISCEMMQFYNVMRSARQSVSRPDKRRPSFKGASCGGVESVRPGHSGPSGEGVASSFEGVHSS